MRSPFAVRRPVLFSGLVTLLFVVLLVGVAVAQRAADDPRTQEAVGAVGRGLIAAGALLWLGRLGWRRWLAGAAPAASWWLAVPPLLYVLAVFPWLFTGSYSLPLEDPPRVSAVALNGFAAGVMEELVFRGLVLGALLAAWGASRRGTWRAVWISSLCFTAPHALNVLAGADPVRVAAQLVWALLLGAVFGALTVAGGSVWPVAALHGLGNAFVHANRLGHETATDPATAVLLALAPLPLVAYAWIVLRRRERLGPAPTG